MSSEPAASAGDSYIGSFISLISKYEIRYEGILYHLNVQDSTIGLKNVRSFGTEGHKKDGAEVLPSEKVYEYILFRGSDIKSGHPGALPPYQSAVQLGQPELSPVTQTSMYPQGYNATSISSLSNPHHQVTNQVPPVMLDPFTMQQLIQSPEIQASATLGPANISEFRTPVSSSSLSTSVNTKFFPSPQVPLPSSLPTLPSLSSDSTFVTTNALTMPSFTSSGQDLNVHGTQIVNNSVSESEPVQPLSSVTYSASSLLGSNLGPLLTQSPILPTPNQSALHGPQVLSSAQKAYSNQNEMAAGVPTPTNFSSSIKPPVTQTPLLPLPTAPQQSVPFTEEFDFTAMNEKFKKDEVWGYLGRGKPTNTPDGLEENVGSCHLEEKEGPALITNPKPGYKKDDFFDTISCNSLNHGRGTINGQSRFFERMKQDTETFEFHQRANLGYGGGRGGKHFRGGRNWGRGYGYGYAYGYNYGGQGGRGGNMPF
ncbi:hypothetical protein G4B88_027997 [Cannabis sativa]|uniref:Protein decapping 5 n=1 Tax=Cannabis sativa TaxID=3483 RepID=A0A7J6I7E0_CANSA|nr:hypothetical protein G4B88_027997 [Cannabis sativa]